MVLLHGANGFGVDDVVLVALGVFMLVGALAALWHKKRQERRAENQ